MTKVKWERKKCKIQHKSTVTPVTRLNLLSPHELQNIFFFCWKQKWKLRHECGWKMCVDLGRMGFKLDTSKNVLTEHQLVYYFSSSVSSYSLLFSFLLSLFANGQHSDGTCSNMCPMSQNYINLPVSFSILPVCVQIVLFLFCVCVFRLAIGFFFYFPFPPHSFVVFR